MKKIWLKCIMFFLCAILGGSLLLVAAYALPLGSIDRHVEESIAVFAEEGDYPVETPGMTNTMRDNYTDALMLNMASYSSEQSLLWKAFGNYKKRTSDTSAITWLQQRNEKNSKGVSYARYWHGYLVPLKILLEFFNYQQIRSLLAFADIFLILWIGLLLQKRKKEIYIVPFLITLMFFPLDVVGKSIQFSTIFIPVLIETGIMLKFYKKFQEQYEGLFFTSGIAAAYMDLLTYPLVSVGFLLCFAMILDEASSLKKRFLSLIRYTLLWGIGYGGMWASKWVLSSVILKENVLKNAMDTAAFRVSTSNGNNSWTYGDVLKNNIFNVPKMAVILAAIFLIYLVFQSFWKKATGRMMICNSVCLIIAAMPFAWYIVLSNHSYIHAFFTYRELSVSCLAILFYFRSFLGRKITN